LDFPDTPQGSTTSSRRFKIRCDQSGGVSDAQLVAINRCLLKQDKHLTPFKSVWQLASLRTSDEVYTFRPYGTLDGSDVSITFTDYDATEGTVSILVDTEGMDVRKMSDGSLVLRGEGLLVDGSTEYVFAEGTMLAGLAFILNGADDSSTATVEIKTGAEVFEHKLSTSSSWAKAISPLSLGSMAESEEKEIDIRVSSYFSQPTSADSYEALFVVEDGASGSTDLVAKLQASSAALEQELAGVPQGSGRKLLGEIMLLGVVEAEKWHQGRYS